MADNSFPKKNRLLSAQDFSNLKSKSFVYKAFNLRVYYSKTQLDNSRIGISVTKKVGNSVVRNRFKRLSREAFRKSNCKNLNFDFLFVVQTSKDPLNTQELNLSKAMIRFFDYLENNV